MDLLEPCSAFIKKALHELTSTDYAHHSLCSCRYRYIWFCYFLDMLSFCYPHFPYQKLLLLASLELHVHATLLTKVEM